MKPGYKQTEVGVIPEDWEVKPVGNLLTLQRGFDLPSRLRKDGEVPIVSSSGVSGTHSVAKIYPPGVVTGRYGTVGEVFFLDTPFWPLNTTLYLSSFKGNDPLFAFYLLKTVDFASHSGKSGVPGVNRNDIHEIPAACPPLPEQRAIAEALSDVDGLLGGLDRLIAKKRDLKQAAMQQLLTAKTRLPGFHGEWVTKSLGELGKWKGGMTPSMQNPNYWENGDIPWVSSGDVKSALMSDTAFKITAEAVKRGTTTMLPPHSIMVVTRSGILRRYLPVATNLVPMAINQDIKALIPNEGLSPSFLLQSLVGHGEAILARCMKSGTTVESIELGWLKAFTIPVPPPAEQTAIAEVLGEMDGELAALERRREKTRALKQAMMQQLLTGQTRLV